ncbi:Lrp/AsnC family transcriptional regulator [Fretibacter rubidus]|uniref:Lrp/AsnC family transcriptional regulator n=1 Tax=Fretibacter rubidus TaxID=570162 RepID=UPI00352A0BEA
MTKYIPDELDHKIIELLFEDARISNRKLAAKLDFTEGTIRSRVKRLEDENLIRFTAVTNMNNLDRPQLGSIGIHVEQNLMQEVIDALAEMPEIGAVIKMFGRFDIMAMSLFEGLPAVHELASNKILALKGVRHVETVTVVDILKYDNRVARIISKD